MPWFDPTITLLLKPLRVTYFHKIACVVCAGLLAQQDRRRLYSLEFVLNPPRFAFLNLSAQHECIPAKCPKQEPQHRGYG